MQPSNQVYWTSESPQFPLDLEVQICKMRIVLGLLHPFPAPQRAEGVWAQRMDRQTHRETDTRMDTQVDKWMVAETDRQADRLRELRSLLEDGEAEKGGRRASRNKKRSLLGLKEAK